MKILDVLVEAIQAPLYNIGLEAIKQGLPNWITASIKLLDQYTNKAQYRHAVRQINDDGYSDERGNLRDQQYDREYRTLVQEDNQGLHEHLVKTITEMLEGQLRQASVSYIESQFGKVERIIPKESFEEMQKRHLYFMQFVSIHIDTKATYNKSGEPRTGGGYFTRQPSKDRMGDKWSQENVDWGNELGFGIKIYSTDNAIWLAAVSVLVNHLQEGHFGESFERAQGLDNLLRDILSVWVHETVHLEQTTRRYVLGKMFYKYDWGMTYTPQRKARPKYQTWDNENNRYKKGIKGGVRGFPSHLSNEEDIDMAEWIEYFGTAHEIEAHAAGAAAQIIHDATIQANNPNYGYRSDHYYNDQINRYIDETIQDISYGQFGNDVGSLRSYYTHIKGEAMRYLRLKTSARDRDISRDPRALNKVNIGARKVWTIFLTKLVKHLQSYKKPTPDWSDRDPRLRTPALPKPTLPG